MKRSFLLAILMSAACIWAGEPDSNQRGRYLIVIGGCNDCHTPGYPESGGKTPESDWLVGSPVGFQGPWGTTYPTNLRNSVAHQTEAEFLAKAHTAMRPPMPWISLANMTDSDLKAVYHYIKSLGPKGPDAPAYKAPGENVETPYFEFVPKNLPSSDTQTGGQQ